jgi:hypothetical protein
VDIGDIDFADQRRAESALLLLRGGTILYDQMLSISYVRLIKPLLFWRSACSIATQETIDTFSKITRFTIANIE